MRKVTIPIKKASDLDNVELVFDETCYDIILKKLVDQDKFVGVYNTEDVEYHGQLSEITFLRNGQDGCEERKGQWVVYVSEHPYWYPLEECSFFVGITVKFKKLGQRNKKIDKKTVKK